MKETLWKNDLNFVKDVGLVLLYVNLITIVIIVSEKKKGGITFVRTFIHCTKEFLNLLQSSLCVYFAAT